MIISSLRFWWRASKLQSFPVRTSFCRALFSYFPRFQPPAINCSVCDLNSGVADKLQYIAGSLQKYSQQLRNRKIYFDGTVMTIFTEYLIFVSGASCGACVKSFVRHKVSHVERKNSISYFCRGIFNVLGCKNWDSKILPV